MYLFAYPLYCQQWTIITHIVSERTKPGNWTPAAISGCPGLVGPLFWWNNEIHEIQIVYLHKYSKYYFMCTFYHHCRHRNTSPSLVVKWHGNKLTCSRCSQWLAVYRCHENLHSPTKSLRQGFHGDCLASYCAQHSFPNVINIWYELAQQILCSKAAPCILSCQYLTIILKHVTPCMRPYME